METPPPVEIDPPGPVHRVIIWLHGLGADGHDFEPLMPMLRLPPELGVRFVLPHAPMQPVTVNGGQVMRAWYDIHGLEIDARLDLEGMSRSVTCLHRLMEQEMARGVAPGDLVLAGFSQGGLIALAGALRWPGALAGVVALSTYLPPAMIPLEAPARRIFQAHGRQDPVVPLSVGRAACECLRAAGQQVDWHEYDMAHSVCPEEVEAIRAWLLERFRAGGEGA